MGLFCLFCFCDSEFISRHWDAWGQLFCPRASPDIWTCISAANEEMNFPCFYPCAHGSGTNNSSADRWEERDFHWHFTLYFFHSTLFFSLLMHQKSPSECPLLMESLKLELYIRSFKIPGVILGQSKSDTYIFFSESGAAQCWDIEDNTGTPPQANIIAVHCAHLKAFSTQVPHGVLTQLSITMPIVKRGNLWPMGLPTVIQIVWDAHRTARKYHRPSVLASRTLFLPLGCSLLHTWKKKKKRRGGIT